MLQLPDFNALSTEQDDILDLPLDTSVIVTGPPGTGKTIIAIWRAHMMDKAGRPTLLLMYGRLLSTYTSAAVSTTGLDGIVSTYHSWFPRFFQESYGKPPPKLDRYTFDWAACTREFMSSPIPKPQRRHIIVDEGQDMPRDFYLALALVSGSMTILADENQRITEHQSTLVDIQSATGIRDLRTLSKNYRNTRPIAEFAAQFYTGLPSGIPTLPQRSRGGERPVLTAHANLHDSLQQVLQYERTFSNQSIGVLVPYARQVKSFHNRLSGKTKNPVQGYLSGLDGRAFSPLDFAKPGIKLVTWASAKGLEFDTVFLPELQSYRGDHMDDTFRMRMYVLASRAKQRLFLQYSGDGEPLLIESLPMNLVEDRR